MLKANEKRKAIYSRKSKFTGKGESIENQVTLCKDYAQRTVEGIDLEDDVIIYEDEGFSGGNIYRPQFTRMMEDVRAGKIDTIICYRLDRISRNIGDFAKLIDELACLKVAFVSIKEQFDTGTPMGKAMMYIASVFSQLERETIAERIRDNMHELAKTGRWLGGVTPTGYVSEKWDRVTVDGKTRTAYNLKRSSGEDDMVQVIFKQFRVFQSLTKTETYLMVNNYRTKTGKEFTRFAIKNILTNPTYMIADEEAYNYMLTAGVDLFAEREEFDGLHGMMAYNRTEQTPHKSNQIKPMDEWIVSVGKHEGLISGADWTKVQELLDENKGKSYRYRAAQDNTAILSGLMYCKCGAFMRPKMTNRKNAKGERVYTYYCERKEKSRKAKCETQNLDGHYMDRWICEAVKTLAEDGSEFRKGLERGRGQFMENRTDYEADLKRVSSAVEENGREIKGLVSVLAKVSGTQAEDEIIMQINELHQKGSELTARARELEELTNTYAMTANQFEVFADLLSSFAKTVDNMTVEQKRAAIRMVIRKVVWDGAWVHIYLFGTEDEGDGEGVDFPYPPEDGGGCVFEDTHGEKSSNLIGTQTKY